jgi:hypothetical protein
MKLSYVLLLTIFVSFMSLVGCQKYEVTLPQEEIVNTTDEEKPSIEEINRIKTSHSRSNTYYNAPKAVSYAKKYYSTSAMTNSVFGNYAYLGTNCTNFVNQCIMAGLVNSDNESTVLNGTNTYHDQGGYYEWYFNSIGNRSYSWAGVKELWLYAKNNQTNWGGMHFDFITRDYSGSNGAYLNTNAIQEGDIVFIDYTGASNPTDMDHAMIVSYKAHSGYSGIYVASHTSNYKMKSLSAINAAYNYGATFHVYRPTFYQ